VRFFIGSVLILAGVYGALTYKRGADRGSLFHRRLATVAPWLYRVFPARAALSSKAWRPLALLGALFIIGVGVIFIVVTPK